MVIWTLVTSLGTVGTQLGPLYCNMISISGLYKELYEPMSLAAQHFECVPMAQVLRNVDIRCVWSK